MIVEADVRYIQIQSSELAVLSKLLRTLEHELDGVKRTLSHQSGFSAQITSLQYICDSVDCRRKSLSSMSQALLDVGLSYQRADRSVADRFAETAAQSCSGLLEQ